MPTITPATFADVLGDARTTLAGSGVLGTPDNTKLSDKIPSEPPSGFMGNELWVIAPGGTWVQEDGHAQGDGDDLILTGELHVGYWLRSTTDGQFLADNLLTDTTLGTTGKIAHLLSVLHSESTTGWLILAGVTHLMRPLMLKGLSFQPQPAGSPWRGVIAVYDCQFRTVTY